MLKDKLTLKKNQAKLNESFVENHAKMNHIKKITWGERTCTTVWKMCERQLTYYYSHLKLVWLVWWHRYLFWLSWTIARVPAGMIGEIFLLLTVWAQTVVTLLQRVMTECLRFHLIIIRPSLFTSSNPPVKDTSQWLAFGLWWCRSHHRRRATLHTLECC